MNQAPRTKRFYSILLFALMAILVGYQTSTAASPRVCFEDRCFDVELAATEEERTKGLQKRAELGADQGMLFIFAENFPYRFWMKDTLIPLDMIWLDDGKKIVHIEANVLPCTDEFCPSYGPQQPARYVLELNAGEATKNNIHVGDTLEFKGIE